MKEILDKLLESELLNDETKKQLEEAFTTSITEAIETAKNNAEVAVRAELTEQYIKDKDALVEALDTKAQEFFSKELEELKEDLAKFRDLEVEYAAKLVDEKNVIAETVKKDMHTLVDTLDTFLEERIAAEMDELKEDLTEAKKLAFGKKIFEAFSETYGVKFVSEDSTKNELAEANDKLVSVQESLTAVQTELNAKVRNEKLTKVLETLQGRPREVMEAVLQNVATDKLEETYNNCIAKVLHQSVVKSEEDKQKESEKSSVLAESKSSEEVVTEAVKVVTGDKKEEIVNETLNLKVSNDKDLNYLRKLSGIND